MAWIIWSDDNAADQLVETVSITFWLQLPYQQNSPTQKISMDRKVSRTQVPHAPRAYLECDGSRCRDVGAYGQNPGRRCEW